MRRWVLRWLLRAARERLDALPLLADERALARLFARGADDPVLRGGLHAARAKREECVRLAARSVATDSERTWACGGVWALETLEDTLLRLAEIGKDEEQA
jgi:hypothetical protein